MAQLWLLTPLVFFTICYGLGFYITLALGRRVNFALVTTIGFLGTIIIGYPISLIRRFAPATPFLIAILGISGSFIAFLWFRRSFRFDKSAALAGVIAYSLYSLPTLMSGRPGWTGWVKLDDSASWFAVADRLMSDGQTTPEVIASTYDRVLQQYVGNGVFGSSGFDYPLGAYIPLGAISRIMHQDVAWIFQPFMSFVAGLLAMLIVLCAKPQVANRRLLVILGVTASIASTLYSYVMWGGLKEIVLEIPLILLAYSLFRGARTRLGVETFSYCAIAVVAFFLVGGASSFGFILPLFLIYFLIRLHRYRKTYFTYAIATLSIFGFTTLGLLISGNDLIGKVLVPPNGGDAGNLARGLKQVQIFGIWPASDFRLDPSFFWFTYLIIAIAALMAMYGLYISITKQFWTVPALVIACLLVVIYSNSYGGIWFTAKALAVSSPIMLLASGIGASALLLKISLPKIFVSRESLSRKLVAMGAGLLIIGVVTSDALTFGNVWLAPYPEVNELRAIGERYAGQGPALMTEYSVHGARYFLRKTDAESVSELRVHVIPMKDGKEVPKGWAADISLFDQSTLDYFNLLVLRKSTVASRPLQNFSLDWSGNYFEVWRRQDLIVRLKQTLDLGGNLNPSATPACKDIRSFLSQVKKSDRVFVAERAPVVRIPLISSELPKGWTIADPDSGALYQEKPGSLVKNFSIPTSGNYHVALAGSFPGKLVINFDGTDIYTGNSMIQANPTLTYELAKVFLGTGEHKMTLTYSQPFLLPGAQSASRFGPLYLATENAGDVGVREISKFEYATLCNKSLDWITIAE